MAFGARAARAFLALPLATTAAAAVFVQLTLNRGATRQLSGIWLGLWASASGGAAQSAFMFIAGGKVLVGLRFRRLEEVMKHR